MVVPFKQDFILLKQLFRLGCSLLYGQNTNIWCLLTLNLLSLPVWIICDYLLESYFEIMMQFWIFWVFFWYLRNTLYSKVCILYISAYMSQKYSAEVSNLWPAGHMHPRKALSVVQHKLVNLFKTWDFFVCDYVSQCILCVAQGCPKVGVPGRQHHARPVMSTFWPSTLSCPSRLPTSYLR